jgi:X-X-X-Leu-X-X-Gly heptad repeat protein
MQKKNAVAIASIRSEVTGTRGRSPRRERGASLLEAIAYLGIAAIVVIGAVALLNGAFSSAGTNELAEQVNAIQTGVKKLYMGQTNGYADISVSTLAAAGALPSTVPVGTNGTATNSFGGTVNVASSTANPNTFTIEFDDVPTAVCINALTATGSWTQIQVTPTSGGSGGTENTFPITPTKAQTDCGTSGTDTITWTST